MHEANNVGNTPLDLLIFSNILEDDATKWDTAALKTLLRLGNHDPKVLDGEPMRLANSKANTMLCRILVEEYGADPCRVVEVGSDGVPRLRDDRRPFAGPNQDEREIFGSILGCFCHLMHLTIPNEYAK